jgi:hypothetical protein
VYQQEQASALHAMGMLDYGALKSRLTVATAALVAIGTATFAVTGAHGPQRLVSTDPSVYHVACSTLWRFPLSM